MPIDQANMLDIIAFTKGGDVNLVIVDHLKWDEKGEHAYLLQEKLKTYLAFVESGEMVSKYPEAKNKHVIISVYAFAFPNQFGEEFLQRAGQMVEDAGMGFRFELDHFKLP